jgi:membrane-bound metal-dependent hydrolase YbcI (DUF457 family)
MANYREHITVSGMLGLGYGLGAVVSFGFTPVQGLLAACLTGVAGMLPDLDSDNGRPVREMFGLVGAVAPLLVVNRVCQLLDLPGDPETVILMVIALYLVIKYGGALFVRSVSVHRGMFHSIPALLIAAELVFLAYPSESNRVRLMIAGAVGIGFLSHLLLDELYSVHVKESRVQLKRSSGTALKLTGEKFGANVVSYTLLAMLTYLSFYDAGWFEQHTPATRGPGGLAVPGGAAPPANNDVRTLHLEPSLGEAAPFSASAWEPTPGTSTTADRNADPGASFNPERMR